DQIEPLERIHRAGAHLLQLINDLLDLSKIEAGKMELHITEFDLAHVISEAVKTAQPLADKNNNRLSVHCPAEIGMLRADDIRLRQAVLNLLSNACKFTESGEVRVEVEASAVDGTDGVSISVADTGIGMMPEHMNMLFQDFVQADTSTTRKYGGTGLGLAISLRFCRLMGGDITVESAPEQGSTFRIWLPRVATVPTTGEEQAIPQPVVPLVERTTAASKQTTAQRTVLVIDDDPNVRDLLTASLTREGYDVATAANGVEGLTRARELKPMLIILDIIMPELDGWAVLTACKGDPDLADIPVIMLTIVDDRTRGYALGAAEYLVKPIDRKRLRAVLEKHCGVHGEILMIEDDEVARDTTRKAAEKQGFTVIEAADGREALKRLAENSPDLILLDLLMPEMDGFEFLVELNKNSDWRDIPVVVLTAKDLTDEDRRRLNGRVTSIAKKGVMSPREILEELRAVIESRQAAVTAA
ncbi:MAG: response regulator, partial [Acidiferrobacterales bacterium]